MAEIFIILCLADSRVCKLLLKEVLVGMWHKGVYYSPLGNIPLHHPPSQAASMQKNNVTQCTVTLYICLAKNDKIVHRYTVDKNSVPLCHQEED